MNRLKAALKREYEDDPNTSIEIHNPRNTTAVELYFRGEKTVKVMGALAMQKPQPGDKVSGILVKRNFNYHLLAPFDVPSKNQRGFFFFFLQLIFVNVIIFFFLFISRIHRHDDY